MNREGTRLKQRPNSRCFRQLGTEFTRFSLGLPSAGIAALILILSTMNGAVTAAEAVNFFLCLHGVDTGKTDCPKCSQPPACDEAKKKLQNRGISTGKLSCDDAIQKAAEIAAKEAQGEAVRQRQAVEQQQRANAIRAKHEVLQRTLGTVWLPSPDPSPLPRRIVPARTPSPTPGYRDQVQKLFESVDVINTRRTQPSVQEESPGSNRTNPDWEILHERQKREIVRDVNEFTTPHHPIVDDERGLNPPGIRRPKHPILEPRD